MKKIVHSRLLCILIMVSMLVLGIYCENIRTDSSFSGSDGKIGTVSLIAALFMADAYLLFLSIQNSALCIAGYGNQYNRRTLDYIHHNDGKKSHNLFLS